jgi:hypothetical protein
MNTLTFLRDGWIEGPVDDADERATLTRLTIKADSTVLTRTYSTRNGGESQALNVPLLPLAQFIAKMWWPLLYEPLRSIEDKKFPARHRLDLPMHGYIFPAVALCSAGNEAVICDWSSLDSDFTSLRFLAPEPQAKLELARDDIEPALMDLVESTLDRLESRSAAHRQLADDWNRFCDTLANEPELAYCKAAGRLGIDPYDADAPDLEQLSEGLSEELLGDISDAADLTHFPETAVWAKEMAGNIKAAPAINVEQFGRPPIDNIAMPAGEFGFRVAADLREKLGLSDKDPRKSLKEFLGAAQFHNAALASKGPAQMTSLVERTNGSAHIGTVARSARQQHFRACAGAFIAWCSEVDELRAGTFALTRRQQASRAFAAEMVAPRAYLQDLGYDTGFTEEDIEDQAHYLIAPQETVKWQAWRAGVPLLGVDMQTAPRNYFF